MQYMGHDVDFSHVTFTTRLESANAEFGQKSLYRDWMVLSTRARSTGPALLLAKPVAATLLDSDTVSLHLERE